MRKKYDKMNAKNEVQCIWQEPENVGADLKRQEGTRGVRVLPSGRGIAYGNVANKRREEDTDVLRSERSSAVGGGLRSGPVPERYRAGCGSVAGRMYVVPAAGCQMSSPSSPSPAGVS